MHFSVILTWLCAGTFGKKPNVSKALCRLRIKSIGPFINPAGDSFCPIDSSNCSLCSSLLMICVVSAGTCIALYLITPPQSILTMYLYVLFTIPRCSGAKRPLWVRQ